VVKHCQLCTNLVEGHGIVFLINVGLHVAQEWVAQDGVGCRAFSQSNGDGGWASLDLIGLVVCDDCGQTEAALALSVDATNCDGAKAFLCECEIDFNKLWSYLVAACMILEIAEVETCSRVTHCHELSNLVVRCFSHGANWKMDMGEVLQDCHVVVDASTVTFLTGNKVESVDSPFLCPEGEHVDFVLAVLLWPFVGLWKCHIDMGLGQIGLDWGFLHSSGWPVYPLFISCRGARE
jgi:hypothetical protein